MSTPTPVKHPWRHTARAIVTVAIATLPVIPEALGSVHLDTTALGAQTIVISGAIARFIALPAVETWLARYVPWLAAQPSTPPL